MTNLKNSIAFITGASSGIGKACAERLASEGVHLILTARRTERLHALAHQLTASYNIRTLPITLDVRDRVSVEHCIKNLPSEWQCIDILINNAGLALSIDYLQDGCPENWDIMIDTNIKGLLYITRAILPQMIKRNTGYIINMGSIAGHSTYPRGNVYIATKHAVAALSTCLRMDLSGTAIRVTEIAPGAVETEFSIVRFNSKEQADAFYEGFDPLVAEDIANTILYCLKTPSRINISELTIYPQAQASFSLINKE